MTGPLKPVHIDAATGYLESGDFIAEFLAANPKFPMNDQMAESVSKMLAQFMHQKFEQSRMEQTHLIWSTIRGAWLVRWPDEYSEKVATAGLFSQCQVEAILNDAPAGWTDGCPPPLIACAFENLPYSQASVVADRIGVRFIPIKGTIS